MPTGSSVSVGNLSERRSWLTEVSEVEKQLWARIHLKGVLDKSVKDLYHRACCMYEKLFLSDNELRDLQHIEYLLWRLQYKHIDEFRRMISQSSAELEDDLAPKQKTFAKTVNLVNFYTDNFRLFLSEATKFYQDLIRKIKAHYGLLDEPWFYKNDGLSARIEPKMLHNCQFVCHRLCICLGDLARYIQLYEKPTNNQRNWSVAASFYLEAAKIYPDGGNPQNQLAVLATYIGDEFLALYHCIRSLAVKEPFPDALRNLSMLFEKNRSSNIVALTDEPYDFCKPSIWISKNSTDSTKRITTNNRTSKVGIHDASVSSDLWTLFIRMTSFFFLDSSLDGFACTFNSTLQELEALLALGVAGLSSALQSYQSMNLSKAGPYRALHIISVLLFAVHNLTGRTEQKILRPKNEGQQSVLEKLAVTVTFTFMGRLVDRCLKGSPVVYFPLLPALLVFVEWLVTSIKKLDVDDEKCGKAMCYFFCSFVKLLNHLQENMGQITSDADIALWEDYELRGFIPLSQTHESLDFSSHWEDEINYKMKNELRAHRIVQAAIKIAGTSSDGLWLNYDDAARKFHTVQAKEFLYRKELRKQKSRPDLKAEVSPQLVDTVKSTVVEEEEDIVFKPIARQNSEPIKLKESLLSPASTELRRASSLLVEQSWNTVDSFSSDPVPSVSSSKQPGQDEHEHELNGSPSSRMSEPFIASGPPSLSSWVLSGDRLSDAVKRRETGKCVLTSIQEMTSNDMGNMSITTVDVSGSSSPVTSPSTSCTPASSASSSPKSSIWSPGNLLGCELQNTVIHEPLGFKDSLYPTKIHQGRSGVSNLRKHDAPSLASTDARPCSSLQFPELGCQNPQFVHDQASQTQNHTTTNVNSLYGSGTSGFGLLDHWSYNDPLASLPGTLFKGSPPLFQPSPSLLQGLNEQRKGFHNPDYQKPHPYASPMVSETKVEPQQLLQYLKQRERQLRQESQITGGR